MEMTHEHRSQERPEHSPGSNQDCSGFAQNLRADWLFGHQPLERGSQTNLLRERRQVTRQLLLRFNPEVALDVCDSLLVQCVRTMRVDSGPVAGPMA